MTETTTPAGTATGSGSTPAGVGTPAGAPGLGAGGGRLWSPGRPERNGWIAGLTAGQALWCVAAVAPALVAFGLGNVAGGLLWLPFAAMIVALAVVRIRGREAPRWIADASRYVAGLCFGWSSFQSKAAAGLPLSRAEPDLPGEVSRLRFLAGPPMPEHGRVCVIHDPDQGRWAATGRVTAHGVGFASPAQCKGLAAGLGEMLKAFADGDRVDRVSFVVRSVPETGTAYQQWAAEHRAPGAPQLATAVADDLAALTRQKATRQEAFLTASAPEAALARPARSAGGGDDGRARVLHRSLEGLAAPLQTMGCDPPRWLDSAGVADAVRAAYNPAEAARIAHSRIETGHSPVDWATAGPSRAPVPAARSYAHDGFVTISYAVIPPADGVRFGSLGALLTVGHPDERRSLAIHYETLPQRAARRIAVRTRQASTLLSEVKASRGFGTAAADAHDRQSSYRMEDAVAAGEAMVRYSIVASVTVPADWNVDAAAEAFEHQIAGSYRLVRLELAQDSGFAASALPLGLGLDRMRTT